jgi:hypothetical protein
LSSSAQGFVTWEICFMEIQLNLCIGKYTKIMSLVQKDTSSAITDTTLACSNSELSWVILLIFCRPWMGSSRHKAPAYTGPHNRQAWKYIHALNGNALQSLWPAQKNILTVQCTATFLTFRLQKFGIKSFWPQTAKKQILPKLTLRNSDFTYVHVLVTAGSVAVHWIACAHTSVI